MTSFLALCGSPASRFRFHLQQKSFQKRKHFPYLSRAGKYILLYAAGIPEYTIIESDNQCKYKRVMEVSEHIFYSLDLSILMILNLVSGMNCPYSHGQFDTKHDLLCYKFGRDIVDLVRA